MTFASNVSVGYNLPVGWAEETARTFSHLTNLIDQIHNSAYSAAVKAINRFSTVRNYVIGYYIVEYEQHGNDKAKYGDKLLERIAEKVNKRGINVTLLKVSRSFYLKYPQIKPYLEGKSATPSHFLQTAAEKIISQLSFSHIREIMTVDDPMARYFYETECIRGCWSVKELRRQISTNLYYRAGISETPALLLAKTNEKHSSSALSINNPFSLEFLGLRPEAITETELENALISHLQEFLLEMGKGFCFEARQKRMIIDDEYYYADLVFYNRILHCSVIVELKDDEFKHADLSQLNAYVSYYRENEMNEGDNPPVGILLCTRKGKKMVEYALAGMDNHLFVSTYKLSLPDTKILTDFLLRETKQA